MAQVIICKVFNVAVVMVVIFSMAATVVSAQDSELDSAPAPAMDDGAAFSTPVSVMAVATTLAVSLIALLKH